MDDKRPRVEVEFAHEPVNPDCEEAEAEIRRLRAFAENVRDNWGAMTGYDLMDGAKRALGE